MAILNRDGKEVYGGGAPDWGDFEWSEYLWRLRELEEVHGAASWRLEHPGTRDVEAEYMARRLRLIDAAIRETVFEFAAYNKRQELMALPGGTGAA